MASLGESTFVVANPPRTSSYQLTPYQLWKHFGIGDGGFTQPSAPPTPPAAMTPPPVNYEEAKADYGRVIPISLGTRRMPGQMIYASAVYGTYPDHYVDLFVSFGYNGDTVPSATRITKLWAGGSKIWAGTKILPGDWTLRNYRGTSSQSADPDYAAAVGASNAPAFRGQLCSFIKKLPLAKFNYVIPGISAEVSSGGGFLSTEFPYYDTGSAWIELSENNTRATNNGDGTYVASFAQAEGDPDAYLVGKQVFAFYIHQLSGAYTMAIGLWHAGYSAGAEMDDVGPCYRSDGNFYWPLLTPSNPRTGLLPYGTGDTVMFCVDTATPAKIWTGVNGVWNQNPNDDSAALLIGGNMQGPPYASNETTPHVQPRNQGDSLQLIPFPYTRPSGTTDWYTTAGLQPGTDIPTVISRLATFAGLDPDTDIEIDPAITDTVTGALITEETSFEDVTMRLGRAFGFDMFAADVIRFVKPVVGSSYTLDVTVPSSDLGDLRDRALTTTRAQDTAPVQMSLNYIDQSQQFRYNTQRARRILHPVRATQSRRRDGFSIPIIISASKALSLAALAMFREADQNVVHSFVLPAEYVRIQPGDILRITAGDTTYDVKVTRVAWRPDWQIGINAVNLFADEDVTLESESGEILEEYTGEILEEITGTLAATDGADTFLAFGETITGTLAATDGADLFEAEGTVGGGGSGYRYWRLNFASSSSLVALSHVELYEDIGDPNLTPSATVTAYSSYGGAQLPANAVDQSDPVASYYAEQVGPLSERWLKFDFGAGVSKDIKGVLMSAQTSLGAGYTGPSQFTLQYSSDGTSWTTLFSQTGLSWVNQETKRFWDTSATIPSGSSSWGTHTYWRVMHTAPGSSFPGLAELEMRATPGGADQLSGGTFTYSSEYINGMANAIDNNDTTIGTHYVSPTPHYLKYQFASPVAVAQVRIKAGTSTGTPGHYNETYKRFLVQFSDDNTNWTTAFFTAGAPASFTSAEQRLTTDPYCYSETAWNPSDKDSDLTLSGSDLTATYSGGVASTSAVRATVSRTTGKWVFAVNPANGNTSGSNIGLITSSQALTVGVYNNAESAYAIVPSGSQFSGSGAADNTIPTWTNAASEIMVAVDLDAKLAWMCVDGGNWNGSGTANPATGVGGHDITKAGGGSWGALYPAIDLFWPGDATTANFGASAFTKTIPSGFQSWDGAQSG